MVGTRIIGGSAIENFKIVFNELWSYPQKNYYLFHLKFFFSRRRSRYKYFECYLPLLRQSTNLDILLFFTLFFFGYMHVLEF